jgi:hypothetical protein
VWRTRLLLFLVLWACGRKPAPDSTPLDAAAAPPDGPPARTSCAAPRRELAPGLVVEKVAAGAASGCVTLARIDPARYRMVVRTAAHDGGPRPVPQWAADFHLAAVTNSSMFQDDRRSIGMLATSDAVNNGGDNPKLGGFLFFDPVNDKDPPVLMTGRTCSGFDLAALRKRYRGVVQNYRMLECDGAAIPWADPKIFSAAVLAVDRDGWVVMAHSRAPLRMSDLARLLAAPSLRLTQALYLEGGPEASLYVKAGGAEVAEVGSFETGFHDDTNRVFWDIPNVIGFEARSAK